MSLLTDGAPTSSFNAAEELLARGTAIAGAAIAGAAAPAFLDGGRTISYADVAAEVRRAAGCLAALGIRPRDRVLFLLPNTFELVVGFLGSVWLGAIPVLVSTAATAEQTRFIINDSGATLLVTSGVELDRLSNPTAAASLMLPQVLRADDDGDFARARRTAADAAPSRGSGDTPALLLYTSGSTGRPKGVLHAQRSLLVCARRYAADWLGLGAGDIAYTVSRISFAYGLGSIVYFPLATGSASVLTRSWSPFEIAADLKRYRPSILWATPSTYAALISVAEVVDLDLSSVRLAVSAAEPLPPAIWSTYRERFGLAICEGLGTTEFLHIFLSNEPGHTQPGTPGRAVPGYRVRVVGADASPAGPGEVGDLEVAGSSRMIGYWHGSPEASVQGDGMTMRTGDRCSMDESGNVRFLGRSDDLFKVNGMWVSPLEVERELAGHPDVEACAVIRATSDTVVATRLTAFVVPRPGRGHDALAIEVKRLARDRLPAYMVPRTVRVVAGLPRTSTGKIDRRALRDEPSV